MESGIRERGSLIADYGLGMLRSKGQSFKSDNTHL